VCLASAGRRRELPLRRLYRADGLRPHRLAADELITALRVPRSVGEGCLTCTVPVRWQPWGESGFPSVCGALRVDVDRGGADARVLDVLAVVQGIAPRPRVLSQLAELRGATLQDPGLADTLARLVHAGCPHVDTLAPDPEFRRHALAVAMKRGWLEVTRSLAAAAAPAAAAP
jgi:CO/xanthine dehydrogenase FAD-binding subunit